MQKSGKLAAQLATVIALTMLFGTSAFAEERHPNTTEVQSQANDQHRWRDHNNTQQQQYRQDRQNRDGNRNWDRGHNNNQQQQFDRGQTYRQYDRGQNNQNWDRGRNFDRQQQFDRGQTNRNFDRGQTFDRGRNFDRGQNFDRGRNFNQQFDRGRVNRDVNRGQGDRNWNGHRYDNRGWGDRFDSRGRRSFLGEGRVTRFEHERGGYRVWIDGGLYPFFIPEARWRLFPLRLGLSIRLGGWYDPLGFVDVYDVGPYAYDGYYGGGGYGYGGAYASGHLRGVVETVDYYRGTVVILDDISGSFVTAVMRGPRMDLRPGDYVDLGGDFTGRGVFEAYRLYDTNDRY